MSATIEAKDTLELIPLFWENNALVPTRPLAEAEANRTLPEVTILHTNDYHSSNDGRPGHHTSNGEILGGISRIAATIKAAKAHGPTLALDAGDSVFGLGTWWDANGAATTARLRGAAGYDLAAIGNHDLEHGLTGLRELMTGGYPMVGANLTFDDPELSRQIPPAYIAQLAGWRIGLTGVTTPDTFQYVPGKFLTGLAISEPLAAMQAAVKALEPMVDLIILITHIGFTGHGFGDKELAPFLHGSKVAAILGGHTHEALDPAPVIGGIVVCNAGAYGANVNQLKLAMHTGGAVEVRASLLPQTAAVPTDPTVEALRLELAANFQSLHDTTLPLPELPNLPNPPVIPEISELSFNRDKGYVLVARALRHAEVDPQAIMMLSLLYVLGSLPDNKPMVSLAELFTVYPNVENLVEVEVSGAKLLEMLNAQNEVVNFMRVRPIRLADEALITAADIASDRQYRVIISQLMSEGRMGWQMMAEALKEMPKCDLGMSCGQLVAKYLEANALANLEVVA